MLTFSNVTPAVFEAVLNELRREATIISPGSQATPEIYDIEGGGITARILYDPSDGRTEVHTKYKPWWMTEALIKVKIQVAIETAQAAIARGA